MSNTKTTKRALLSSVVAMLVCITMLIGTTFAWFTDTASTAVNKIQAGTLDIALQMKDASGNWVNAEGETLSWKKAAGAPNGEQVLWEPGCTYELPELRIVNKGNLALKYKINVNGIVGNAKLLEVITFTYGDDININAEVTLAPNAKTEGIIIKGHMDEAAGNEYQGLSIDGIGITVVATQVASEFDSFGNQYDKDAPLQVNAIGVGDIPVTDGSAQNNAVVKTEQTISSGAMDVTYPANVILSTTGEVTGDTDKKTSVTQELEYKGDSPSAAMTGISIDDGKAVASYELTLPVSNYNTTPVTVKIKYYVGLTGVQVYHSGTLLTATANANGESAVYDPEAGTLTLTLKHSSPIDVVYDAVAVKEVPVATVTFANGTKTEYLASKTYEVADPSVTGFVDTNWSNEYKALSRAFYDVGRTGGTIVINRDLTFGEKDASGLEIIGDYTLSEKKSNRYKKSATVKEVVLDLAGHSINMTYNETNTKYSSSIYFANINVTIKDSSAEKTGTISSHHLSVLSHLGIVVLRVEGGSFLSDCVNGSIHGIGIMKGGDYVYDDEAEKFVPGQVSMTGGTLSYADAMEEANSISHKTYLDTFNETNVAEGYIGTFNQETGCITVTAK